MGVEWRKWSDQGEDLDSPITSATKDAAAIGAGATFAAIQAFEDPTFAWPASVAGDIPIIVERWRAELAYYESLVRSTTWREIEPWGEITNVEPAIRAGLGLPPPYQGC